MNRLIDELRELARRELPTATLRVLEEVLSASLDHVRSRINRDDVVSDEALKRLKAATEKARELV